MNKPLFSAALCKETDDKRLAEAIIKLAYADLTPEQKAAIQVVLTRLDTLEAKLSELAKEMRK